jgi:hypothetical protein
MTAVEQGRAAQLARAEQYRFEANKSATMTTQLTVQQQIRVKALAEARELFAAFVPSDPDDLPGGDEDDGEFVQSMARIWTGLAGHAATFIETGQPVPDRAPALAVTP